MGKRQGIDIVDFLKDVIYKDKQVLEDGAHITVKKVFNFRERGNIDFGGGEYKECEIAEINPEERSVDDKYGWWRLEEGEYLIEYNEKLKDSIPEGDIIIIQPAKRLIMNGAYHPTLIIGESGCIRTILYVGENGLNIKENARISKLLILTEDIRESEGGKF
jgi:hypothetical protein